MGNATPYLVTMSMLPFRSERALSILLILLAFTTRLHNLGGDSFWVDEALTIGVAAKGWGAYEGDFSHPGLFFLITAASYLTMGESEFAARLSPMFFSLLSVPLLILAGKMLGRTSWGLWAALLLTLTPFHVRHAQDARMYAQLMFFSLASYILLYQALKRPRWKLWIAFVIATILNLYTHNGALVVLASQSILIAAWGFVHLRRRDYKKLLFPATAAFMVILLYIPQLSRFLFWLPYNLGADTVTATGSRASLGRWFRIGRNDFGTFDDLLLDSVFVGLCLVGLFLLARKRRWLALGWIGAGLIVPLLLINIFQVARGAFSRYIIFLLPFYLLAIAITVDAGLNQLKRLPGKAFYPLGVVGTVALFIWAAYPLVQDEHRAIREDWQGIVHYLDQVADEDDVLLTMSLNWRNPFNLVGMMLPFYLERHAKPYTLLVGNEIRAEDVVALKENKGNAVAVFNQRVGRPEFEDESLTLTHFLTNLYVLHDEGGARGLDGAIDLYKELLPLAYTPIPQCLLQQDMSTLHLAVEDYWSAQEYLDMATAQCPDPPDSVRAEIRSSLEEQIRQGAMSHDWSWLIGRLAEEADEDALFLSLKLGEDDYDRRVTGSLPVHLEQAGRSYRYLPANGLEPGDLEALARQQTDLWLIVTLATGTNLAKEIDDLSGSTGSGIEFIELEDDVYLLHDPNQTGSTLKRLSEVYSRWLLYLVTDKRTTCEIPQDLVLLTEISREYLAFAKMLFRLDPCTWPKDHAKVEEVVHRGLRDLFDEKVQAGEMNAAGEIAVLLIQYDIKDNVALELVTVENLMEWFDEGEVVIDQNGGPEPVEVRRFTMPHNGDWGDVLFTHPPAFVSFDLELPEEPVALRTRIALDPQSWGWGGDGVTFVVTVEEGEAPPVEVYRYHLSNDETGHDWHDVLLSLEPYADLDIRLTLTTELGPAGDGTGDWAGWETPRLIRVP